MGDFPPCSVWLPGNHRVLASGRQELQRQGRRGDVRSRGGREIEDAGLEGAGRGHEPRHASRNRKRQGNGLSPEPPEGAQPCY